MVTIVKRRTRLVVFILATVLIVGIVAAVLLWPRKADVATKHTNEVIVKTVDVPSESKPSEEYHVAETAPLSIEIPSASIKGFIQKVGVDQHGAVTAPNNIHFAGWFIESVLPGQKGLSIIDGHEGGPTMDGIFKQLPSVKEGEVIRITMGSGQVFEYKIFQVQVAPKEEAAAPLFNQSPHASKGQLNLITCTGTYSDKARTYDKRAVIYAELQ